MLRPGARKFLSLEMEFGMASNVDDILPKASDVMMRIAEVRAMQRKPHDALLRLVDDDVLQRRIHVR